jgi:hypothetical protein
MFDKQLHLKFQQILDVEALKPHLIGDNKKLMGAEQQTAKKGCARTTRKRITLKCNFSTPCTTTRKTDIKKRTPTKRISKETSKGRTCPPF